MCTRMADKNPLNVCYGPERRPWHESLSEVAVTMDGELLLTPPTCDPLQLESYPEVAGITSSWYQVPSTGLSHDQREQALDETSTAVHKGAAQMLGFQGCENFDYLITREIPLVKRNPTPFTIPSGLKETCLIILPLFGLQNGPMTLMILRVIGAT